VIAHQRKIANRGTRDDELAVGLEGEGMGPATSAPPEPGEDYAVSAEGRIPTPVGVIAHEGNIRRAGKAAGRFGLPDGHSLAVRLYGQGKRFLKPALDHIRQHPALPAKGRILTPVGVVADERKVSRPLRIGAPRHHDLAVRLKS
jgi:hypothetical protein